MFRAGALPGVNILTQGLLFWMADTGHYREIIEMGEPYVAQVAAATDDDLTVKGVCRFAYSALATAHDVLGEPETAQHWRRLAIAANDMREDQINVTGERVADLFRQLTFFTDRVAERRAGEQAAVTAAEACGARRGSDVAVQIELIEVHLDYIEGRWDNVRTLLIEQMGPPGQAPRRGPVWLSILWREQGESERAWERIQEFLSEGSASEPGNSDFLRAVALQKPAIALALDAGQHEQARAWQALDRVRAIYTPLKAVRALRLATAISARLAVRRGQRMYPAGLSPREAEVLGLVARGLTDAQVAERLFISPRTVGVHLSSSYNKLGVNSRVDATRFAIQHGLDGPAEG